jgi:hypothetical protein
MHNLSVLLDGIKNTAKISDHTRGEMEKYFVEKFENLAPLIRASFEADELKLGHDIKDGFHDIMFTPDFFERKVMDMNFIEIYDDLLPGELDYLLSLRNQLRPMPGDGEFIQMGRELKERLMIKPVRRH